MRVTNHMKNLHCLRNKQALDSSSIAVSQSMSSTAWTQQLHSRSLCEQTVDSLHRTSKHVRQCKECALRVPRKTYAKHLDEHYVKKEMMQRRLNRRFICRGFYPHEEEWPRAPHPYDREHDSSHVKPEHFKAYSPGEYVAQVDMYNHVSAYVVPMGDECERRACFQCFEPLDNVYDHTRDEWVYNDAVACTEGVCHAACAPMNALVADLYQEFIMQVE